MTRVLVLLAMLGCALASAAASAPAIQVAGEYVVTNPGALTCVPIGNSPSNFRCTITGFTSDYSGTLTGSSTLDFVQFIDCRRGTTHGHGFETFTGTVAGVGSGTLTWQTTFHASFDCTTLLPSDFRGRGSITGGTGALASLRGPLTFTIDTYEGVLH